MAAAPLKVMLSSRCSDPFADSKRPLSEIRGELKRELEAERLFGRPLYDVWINEEEPSADGVENATEACLRAVDDADVVIALFNAHAGWASSHGGLGICHAELAHGLSTAPAKVRLVALPEGTAASAEQVRLNDSFKAFVGRQNRFRGGQVSTEVELKQRVKLALAEATLALARLGVRETRKGRYATGDALAWTGLSLADRRQAIIAELRRALVDAGGSADGDLVTLTFAGQPVLTPLHAVPAAMSVAPAREMTGRPFLGDHTLAGRLEAAAGPLHLIGCHRAATETQAMQMLGFPDASFVRDAFGIYVADNVQKVQFVFLNDCRDPATTRLAVQRLLDWLGETEQTRPLVERALARARIVRAIAREATPNGPGPTNQ